MTSSVIAARCLEAFAWQQGADSSQQEREMADIQRRLKTLDTGISVEELPAARGSAASCRESGASQ